MARRPFAAPALLGARPGSSLGRSRPLRTVLLGSSCSAAATAAAAAVLGAAAVVVAAIAAAGVRPVVAVGLGVGEAHSLLGTEGYATQLQAVQGVRLALVVAAAVVRRDCTSAAMKTGVAGKCSFVCVESAQVRCCRRSSSLRSRRQRRLMRLLGVGRWKIVEGIVGSILGAAVAVTGAAGMMCWAVAAGAPHRRCTKPGLGMVVMVAGVVGTGREALHRTAVVLMTVDRIEGTAAGAETGSWVVVAHMDLTVLHYLSSRFRCLETRVHQKGSGNKRWRQDEASHTSPQLGYMCWTDAPQACDRNNGRLWKAWRADREVFLLSLALLGEMG